MRTKLIQFMIGRYGVDDFGRALSGLSMFALLLGIFLSPYASVVGLLLFGYTYFRIFSRNIAARRAENTKYLARVRPLKSWLYVKQQALLYRKTHRFYTCPTCKKSVKIPKPPHHGKNIEITCSNCNTKFIRKS